MIMKCAEDSPLADRIRRHRLCLALVAVSQGIAFFHAGDPILRSKSLDRDSYNSGPAATWDSICCAYAPFLRRLLRSCLSCPLSL